MSAKMIYKSLLTFLLLFTVDYTSIESTTFKYEIQKKESTINFSIKHLIFLTARGYYNDFFTTIIWNDKDLSKCSFEGKVDVRSIETGAKKYNELLQTDEFLNSKRYPYINFNSTTIKRVSENRYEISGLLTVKGLSQKITEPLIITRNSMSKNDELVLKTTFNIDRSIYKIAPNYTWPLLDNIVKININLVLKKQEKMQVMYLKTQIH